MKALVAAFCGVFVFALAWPAAAHVTVSSPDAKAGDEAVITFHVPTESDKASTVKVAIQLPPMASVSVLPMSGWNITTHSSKLAKPLVTDDGDKVTEAVTEVDWTATSKASAVAPGQFQQFTIEAGPLPQADSLAFGAIQTYSDKTVVRWNEVAAPGSDAEPDHPKPVLMLSAQDPSQPAAKSASTTGPTVLAIVALVVAAAALGFAVVSRARRQEGSSS